MRRLPPTLLPCPVAPVCPAGGELLDARAAEPGGMHVHLTLLDGAVHEPTPEAP